MRPHLSSFLLIHLLSIVSHWCDFLNINDAIISSFPVSSHSLSFFHKFLSSKLDYLLKVYELPLFCPVSFFPLFSESLFGLLVLCLDHSLMNDCTAIDLDCSCNLESYCLFSRITMWSLSYLHTVPSHPTFICIVLFIVELTFSRILH